MLELDYQLLRSFLEHTSYAYLIHDEKGAFLDFNAVFYERLGYSKQDFQTKTVFDIEVAFDQDTLVNEIWPSMADKQSVDVQGLHRRKDGSVYPCIVNITCLKRNGKSFFLALSNDISETEQVKSHLEKLAMTDDLTQLANRRAFSQAFEADLSSVRLHKKALSLLMFDIDYFKKINDKYGHQVGDIVLQKLTSSIKKQLRTADFFARLGGEEFAIILRNTGLSEAKLMAERIRQAVESLNIEIEAITINVTASFGVVAVDSESEIIASDRLFKLVDDAVYEAKAAGRNTVSLATTSN